MDYTIYQVKGNKLVGTYERDTFAEAAHLASVLSETLHERQDAFVSRRGVCVLMVSKGLPVSVGKAHRELERLEAAILG